jgi:hypothetical protein
MKAPRRLTAYGVKKHALSKEASGIPRAQGIPR